MRIVRNWSVVVVVVAMGIGACSSAPPAEESSSSEGASGGEQTAQAGPSDPETMKTHLREHMQYPADRATIVAACNGMSDINEADRAWFIAALPEGTYDSADAVIAAVGL